MKPLKLIPYHYISSHLLISSYHCQVIVLVTNVPLLNLLQSLTLNKVLFYTILYKYIATATFICASLTYGVAPGNTIERRKEGEKVKRKEGNCKNAEETTTTTTKTFSPNSSVHVCIELHLHC